MSNDENIIDRVHAQNLCDYMKEIYERKWIAPRDGNISYRPYGNNETEFLITPCSVRKHQLRPDMIVRLKIQPDGGIEKQCLSRFKPTGELGLHSSFMKTMRGPLCVVHCHPPYILAFIGLWDSNHELKEIMDFFPELDMNIADNIPYIEAKTNELADAVFNALKGGCEIVALKHHGVVCVATHFETCVERIETIEYYCRIALMERISNIETY